MGLGAVAVSPEESEAVPPTILLDPLDGGAGLVSRPRCVVRCVVRCAVRCAARCEGGVKRRDVKTGVKAGRQGVRHGATPCLHT